MKIFLVQGNLYRGSGEYGISTRLNSLRFYARSFVSDGRPLALTWCSLEERVSCLSFLEARIACFQGNAKGRKFFLVARPNPILLVVLLEGRG